MKFSHCSVISVTNEPVIGKTSKKSPERCGQAASAPGRVTYGG